MFVLLFVARLLYHTKIILEFLTLNVKTPLLMTKILNIAFLLLPDCNNAKRLLCNFSYSNKISFFIGSQKKHKILKEHQL